MKKIRCLLLATVLLCLSGGTYASSGLNISLDTQDFSISVGTNGNNNDDMAPDVPPVFAGGPPHPHFDAPPPHQGPHHAPKPGPHHEVRPHHDGRR